MHLAFTDDDGNAYEHPHLLAAARSGTDVGPLDETEWVPLPEIGATLAALPGRRPVGLDPTTGEAVIVDDVEVEGRSIQPHALAALFPPGWTRTALPASAEPVAGAPPLPTFAYTAVAFAQGRLYGAAVRTDARTHWDPQGYNTPDLDARIQARLDADPTNTILRQVARCAHEYRCFTAQNVFYERYEAAIPLSTVCNAACIGCLSQQDEGGPPPSQWRIAVGPGVDECVRLARDHFARAGEDAIVSWGQGCEGEPLTRAGIIAEACRKIRAHTDAGTLHVNTNASKPDLVAELAEAGLDSVRVSTNSARAQTYEPYYRPRDYGWEDVRTATKVAKDAGLFVSLNLLTFPGVNDTPEETDALIDFVRETGLDMIQTRNLCIDPELYLATVGRRTGGVGIRTWLETVLAACPDLSVGNYNVPRKDFGARALRPSSLREASFPRSC